MPPLPSIAVVVPVYNKIDWTVRFLESFQAVNYPNYTILIADDGSTDGTAQVLAERYPYVVRLQGDGNLWWSGATNLGVCYALEHGFDYVLTINNDTRVSPEFLTHLWETATANPRSLVGSRINFLDEPAKVWHAGGFLRWSWLGISRLESECGLDECVVLARKPNPRPVEVLTGCGTLVPIQCYREIGLYDARFLPQYHADTDFILRAAKHGYRALVDLRAVIWNDVPNTISRSVSKFADLVFSQRSPLYWRSMIVFHLRYCPRYFPLTPLLIQYATTYLWRGFASRFGAQSRWGRMLRNLGKRMIGCPK